MNTLTDEALMLKVKSGETFRLGLLYERYKKKLFGFFFQMNKDADLSEDLVQNVFIRVLKYKHTYTEESKFITWLFKIARNVSYDDFKKNKEYRHQKDIVNVENRISSPDSIEEKMIYKENVSILKIALQKLSYEKREILLLSKYKELKYKEIGEVIGCNEGAARTKVHRALNELKDFFLVLEKR